MTHVRPLGALSFLALVSTAVYACSSSSSPDSSQFSNPPADSGVTPDFDANPPINGITGDTGITPPVTLPDGAALPDVDAQAVCTPTLPPSYTPKWHPPVGSKTGQCTSQQITDFYTSCLNGNVASSGCTSFVSANATCAACLQSDETDAKYGPVVWHQNKAYFTLNIAGCIANEMGDTSATGCAAAYQSVVVCKEDSCSTCFADTQDFTKFAACESQAGTGDCAKYRGTEQGTCGDAGLHDANDPASICTPPSNTPTQTVYETFAPIFCGQ
jgi:hypothetical protein